MSVVINSNIAGERCLKQPRLLHRNAATELEQALERFENR